MAMGQNRLPCPTLMQTNLAHMLGSFLSVSIATFDENQPIDFNIYNISTLALHYPINIWYLNVYCYHTSSNSNSYCLFNSRARHTWQHWGMWPCPYSRLLVLSQTRYQGYRQSYHKFPKWLPRVHWGDICRLLGNVRSCKLAVSYHCVLGAIEYDQSIIINNCTCQITKYTEKMQHYKVYKYFIINTMTWDIFGEKLLY